jgi:hypothetical protein
MCINIFCWRQMDSGVSEQRGQSLRLQIPTTVNDSGKYQQLRCECVQKTFLHFSNEIGIFQMKWVTFGRHLLSLF